MSTIATTATEQVVFLVGRPPMAEFLGFVQTKSLPGAPIEPSTLAQRWRAAYAHIKGLEKTDGYIPRPTGALPTELATLADRVLATPMVQRTFALLPTEFGIVELDNLIVHQKHINLDYVAALDRLLGASSSAADIFGFAIPWNRQYDVPVHVARTAQNAWTFSSPSSDFRQLQPHLVAAEELPDLPLDGVPSAAIVLPVGYGSNFLTAINVDGRLILNNGSHRAYALRDAGHTHAPCLIQSAGADELEATGAHDVIQRPDAYLQADRPPLLKDYFDPELRMIVDAPRTVRQIQVGFGYELRDAPVG